MVIRQWGSRIDLHKPTGDLHSWTFLIYDEKGRRGPSFSDHFTEVTISKRIDETTYNKAFRLELIC